MQTGERRLNCEYCGKDFAHNCNLRRHIITVHNGGKSQICQFCGEVFTQSSFYKMHINTAHFGGEYKCSKCNCTFNDNVSLAVHSCQGGQGGV